MISRVWRAAYLYQQLHQSSRAHALSGADHEQQAGRGGLLVDRSLLRATAESSETLPSVVQVMNDEQGLEGCWFTGAVCRLHEGYALVQYADLQTPDEGAQLQEWFRIPGEVVGTLAAAVQAGHDAHHSLSYKLRPAPPAQVSCWGQRAAVCWMLSNVWLRLTSLLHGNPVPLEPANTCCTLVRL